MTKTQFWILIAAILSLGGMFTVGVGNIEVTPAAPDTVIVTVPVPEVVVNLEPMVTVLADDREEFIHLFKMFLGTYYEGYYNPWQAYIDSVLSEGS